MVLCVSIYYYGHILTNLATFSTTTIKDVSALLFFRSTERLLLMILYGVSLWVWLCLGELLGPFSLPACLPCLQGGNHTFIQAVSVAFSHFSNNHRWSCSDNKSLVPAGL